MLDLKELISLVLDDTGLSDELKSDFEASTKVKLSNIENLIRVASDFQKSYLDTGLESFMAYLKDIAKTDYDNPDKIEISVENSIKLMSIHAAKGLEFEAVFLPMLWKNDYLGRSSGKNGFVVPAELRNDGSIWKEKKNYRSAVSFKEDLKELKMEEAKLNVESSLDAQKLQLEEAKLMKDAGVAGQNAMMKKEKGDLDRQSKETMKLLDLLAKSEIAEKKSEIDLEKIRTQSLEKVANMDSLDETQRSMKLLDVMSKAILQDAKNN